MARITVRTGERAVAYRDGVFAAVLDPGRHRMRRARRVRVERVDLRARQVAVTGQEVFTSDGITVRATAVLRWHVHDPRAFLERAENPFEVLYTAVQLALRDVLGRRTFDELLRVEGREAARDELAPPVTATAGEVGVTVLDVVVRDLAVVGELRAALAQTALERQRGLAALERARGESAALRSLANSAKLLRDNPELARLRLVQAVSEAGGTIVLSPVDASR